MGEDLCPTTARGYRRTKRATCPSLVAEPRMRHRWKGLVELSEGAGTKAVARH